MLCILTAILNTSMAYIIKAHLDYSLLRRNDNFIFLLKTLFLIVDKSK